MKESVLQRVVYLQFEHEESALSNPWHELDREVQLEMSDGKVWFISWFPEPVQYAVAYSPHSFFSPPSPKAEEASSFAPWSNMLGQPVEWLWVAEEHQVLELRTNTGSAFISSLEKGHWNMDAITVSGHALHGAAQPGAPADVPASAASPLRQVRA
jgi:hypothetical protein